MKCAEFKKIEIKEGIFDNFVDATYIIHLVGNNRYEEFYKQIYEFSITKKTYIYMNQGFKKCKKKLPKQLPQFDITHSFLSIFKHAKDNNYDNILILEDDFVYHQNIKNKKNVKSIKKFIENNKEIPLIYYLGTLPWLKFGSSDHKRILISSGNHACIYNKLSRELIEEQGLDRIDDWDVNLNFKTSINRYCFHKPLCYQYFPITDNQNNWWNPLGVADMFKKILKFNELDKKLEPGYSNFYLYSEIGFFIIIGLLILILYIGAERKKVKIQN